MSDDEKMVTFSMTIEELPTLSNKQFKLKKAFQSAKSADESLKAFNKMEPSFQEPDLALPCFNLAKFLLKQARPEQALVFGKRSLQILLSNISKNVSCFGIYCSPPILTHSNAKGVRRTCSVIHNSSFFVAYVCNVLGNACVDLKRYDESLGYLNWANRNLTMLEQDSEEVRCVGDCVLQAVVTNQFQLFRVKFYTNRYGELPIHAVKSLEVKRKMLDEGCIKLGDANMEVSLAYAMAMNFKDALPFGLRALEIRTEHFGSDSVEVMETRNHLGWVYKELQEYEKGLEQEELSKGFAGVDKELIHDSMIESGRYEEAIAVLKDLVLRDDMEGDQRAAAFISMATAFYKLGKFPDAKKCMRTARRILEKVGFQIYVAVLLERMAELYEKMNDFETALSLIRKVLANPNLSQNLLSLCASKFFVLVPKSCKGKKLIRYMLDLVEKLKESFGPDHFEVGYGYAHLGAAYWNSGQQELAVKFLTDAKGIMDATIGPNHVNSLNTSQILATSYANLGRYDLAIEIQEKVVEGFKALGPSEHEFLEKAVILEYLEKAVVCLDKMKKEVAESPTSSSPQFQDGGEDLSAMISKCGISEDETEK